VTNLTGEDAGPPDLEFSVALLPPLANLLFLTLNYFLPPSVFFLKIGYNDRSDFTIFENWQFFSLGD
jgi:hypothetical protein